jgi:succinate dehydrogenase hydrophobic anchor subunit
MSPRLLVLLVGAPEPNPSVLGGFLVRRLGSSVCPGSVEGDAMSDWMVSVVTIVVLVGITALLIGAMIRSILHERRRSRIRKLWSNFGLSLTFCVLFLVSWVAHAVAEWGIYRAEQLSHGEQATGIGFVIQFGESTLENWQSEFLQLFSFVVLAALLIHRGSAESKDGEERIEQRLDEIKRQLDDLQGKQARA